jgi:hypothetical protein
MTNLNSQTTADFRVAYIAAADADNNIHIAATTASDESIGDDDYMSPQ